ncbi:MAG: signal peptidase II, partial [Deltaproteobacteria bacterium]|nr:signal peptidase II [Deltaproteobacteria bacterium]
RLPRRGRALLAAALALIIGGALGNVIDRAIYGYVIDFLHVHHEVLAWAFEGGYFPAFNVADSAISVGVVVLLWCTWREPAA